MMKIQDLVFLAVLALVVGCRESKVSVILGLICLVLAIPLFGFKIMLFTAERLTWYAAGFFLLALTQLFLKSLKTDENRD